MGTQANTETARPNLHNLPDDVVLQMLDHLTPADISAYAQLNARACETATDPTVWASAARRHLAIAPSHPQTLTSQIVYDLACKLVCHWWLVTGAFVAGVPVHRRSGFTSVCPRGGIEVPVLPDASETCYVFGGRHANRSIPASVPSVVLDFPIDPAGPFPVDGMRLRLVHAAEPEHIPSSTTASNPTPRTQQVTPPTMSSPLQVVSDDRSERTESEQFCPEPQIEHTIEQNLNQATFKPPLEAHVTITLNSHAIKTMVCKPSDRFTELHVSLPSNLLVTKPVLNTLAIEYHRDSTAGYWLRDVTLTPAIVPLPPLPAGTLEFPLAASSTPFFLSSCAMSPPPLELPSSGMHPLPMSSSQSSPTTPRSPRTPRNHTRGSQSGDTSPGRTSRRQVDGSPPSQPVTGMEAPSSPRHIRSGKNQKTVKRSKHVYHKQNHHRSTRASHGTGRARSHR